MIADNYQDAINQMRDYGLDVLHVDELDKWVRCKEVNGDAEKRCQYKLTETRLDDGRIVLVGTYGIFRAAEFFSEQIKLGGKTKLSDSERAAIRAKQKANEAEIAAKRAKAASDAADKAKAEWATLEPATDHPYLTRKRVKAFGLRIASNGDLAIPMLDGKGNIHGLQWIYAKPKNSLDKLYWPPGVSTRGHFHLIGEPAWIVLICEGYATGASLAMATDLPVAVAFDAGNLLPVGEAIKARYPRAKILFCADDDYFGDTNTGVNKASQAALAVGGSWMQPAFANERPSDVKGDTDFNDLHVGYGLDAVTEQVFAHLTGLGWKAAAPKAPAAAPGEEGLPSLAIRSADQMAERFALIFAAKSTVFDFQERCVMALSDLRDACANKNYVREWQENPSRIVVRQDQVGFDPTERDTNIRCNLWAGWPTTPKPGECSMLLDLLYYLCSAEDNAKEVYDWIIKWLAYPIQHPGAKMQSALLVHGPEGTGKNTFFGCVRQIFGRYGGIFGQTELESDYNGWASGKLFMIGNEVVTRAELYHQQGRLKNMITEPEWMVNEKFMPARNEANHCNFVFFSNRIDIAKLDKGDRRFCVVWTPEAMDKQVYDAVAAEIANGGAAALHDYLRNIELGDFNEHTKPPMTRAKRDLIDLSMDNPERFYQCWRDQEIPLPFGPCLGADLYEAYQRWCRINGVAKPVQANTLLATFNKKPGCHPTGEPSNVYRGTQKTKMRLYVPATNALPDGKTKIQWLTESMESFATSLSEWRSA